MNNPVPRWTDEQFVADAAIAQQDFRRQRLGEPLARWKTAFDAASVSMRRLIDDYGLAAPGGLTPENVIAILHDGLEDEFRYLAGPPISADDLKVLSETSLAPQVLELDGGALGRVLATIREALDPKRFPWVGEERPPSRVEMEMAIAASAALLARQRIQTERAHDGKTAQEIRTLTDAPPPGRFSGEALVGSRKADICVRLLDGRLLPIECKVSNSSTNSVKRLNNDAAVKAGIWLREFGTKQIVPAAILSGVFKLRNLIQAQEGGLTIFWAHRLDALGAFIEDAR